MNSGVSIEIRGTTTFFGGFKTNIWNKQKPQIKDGERKEAEEVFKRIIRRSDFKQEEIIICVV